LKINLDNLLKSKFIEFISIIFFFSEFRSTCTFWYFCLSSHTKIDYWLRRVYEEKCWKKTFKNKYFNVYIF